MKRKAFCRFILFVSDRIGTAPGSKCRNEVCEKSSVSMGGRELTQAQWNGLSERKAQVVMLRLRLALTGREFQKASLDANVSESETRRSRFPLSTQRIIDRSANSGFLTSSRHRSIVPPAKVRLWSNVSINFDLSQKGDKPSFRKSLPLRKRP